MGAKSMFLLPIGWLYGKIADIRNALYDRGTFRSHDLGVRTISVGNITVGGTGKTPLVAYVAQILADAGEKVCILTRGYGRENPRSRVLVSNGKEVLADARTGGDESVELARKLIGKAVVVADADRVAAAAWARETLGITAFVLDDGFQHRRAKRDVDIVCVDATDPFGDQRLLPSLREPRHNLKRAHAIAITRVDLVDSTSEIVDRIRSLNSRAAIFGVDFRLAQVTKLSDFYEGRVTVDDDEDQQFVAGAFAFCGVGNPRAFLTQLEAQHFSLSGSLAFADHYRYEQKDIDRIEAKARSGGARGMITTAKDAVKLRGLKLSLPCFVAELEVYINDPIGFRELITSS